MLDDNDRLYPPHSTNGHDDNVPTPVPTHGTPGATPRTIGKVASPIRHESTSTLFYFWVPRNTLVEKTQLVRTESVIGGQPLRFYGKVEEVFRRSRQNSIDAEYDVFDGDPDYQPPFGAEGLTFATVTILRIEPPVYTPPLEQSPVYLGDETDAAIAYSYAEMLDEVTEEDWGLPIGVIRNGALATVGVAKIDLRRLNGDRAGHLNITGQAGIGTKSSTLLVWLRSLLDFARAWDNGDPHRTPLSVRPIIFNVKGRDLMFIDFPNRGLTPERRRVWEAMGILPRPFEGSQFFAPCNSANRAQPSILRPVEQERQTRPYYWTLADVVRYGLWSYLFSDATQANDNMMALADHILESIAETCPADNDHPAGMRLRTNVAASFEALRTWMQVGLQDKNHAVRGHGVYAFATLQALVRRLSLVFGREGRQIFDTGPGHGRPLQVLAQGTTDPLVIDINTLPSELRRFVVAAVLDQVKEWQTSENRIPGQVYFLMLDELGIYAPRGAGDPITRLFEHVAAQLRSQGIILLGAQQQASKVSETVFGNSEIKALGATSPVELESSAWSRLLTPAQKAQVLALRPEEKMVLTDRGWMHIIVPYPAWAMKESEIAQTALTAEVLNGSDSTNGAVFSLNLPEDER
jgi:hypothetical protein